MVVRITMREYSRFVYIMDYKIVICRGAMIALTIVVILTTQLSNACEMPLKPSWRKVSVNFVSVCETAECNKYLMNDPNSIRVDAKLCLANIVVDGRKDTAAIFGSECNNVPENFDAMTPGVRCYEKFPMVVEMLGS